MKKILLFLALVIILFSVSCGSDKEVASNNGTKPVVLRIWGGVPPEAGYQTMIDLFNEEFKDEGIQAEYVRYVNDVNGNLKLETTLLAGTGIDLYISYGSTVYRKRVDSNMALDLTDFIEKDGFSVEESVGPAASQFKIDGNYYCMPTMLYQYGILVNQDMFEVAGIPIPTEWTYSEFREIAKQLTIGEGTDKVYGMFFNTQQDLLGHIIYFAGNSIGGNWMYEDDNDAKSGFLHPAINESTQLIYDMMNVDKSATTHVDSVTQKLSQEGMFIAGKSAMSIGPWIIRSIKNTENYPHDFKTALAPYPISDTYPTMYTNGGLGDLLSINPKSANIDAAWKFMKWYTTKGMLPITGGGRVPAYVGYDIEEVTNAFLGGAEDLLDADSVYEVLIKPKDNYAITTITTKAPELTTILTEETEAILNNIKTIDEGLQSAYERANKILAK